MSILLHLVLLSVSTASAKPAVKATPSRGPVVAAAADDSPQPIDVVLQRVRQSSASKNARKIARASASLKKNKYAAAREGVRGIRGDEWFGDYGPGPQARAWLAEAEKEKDSSKAQKAIELLLEIERRFPYSPFLKKSGEQMALAELIIADGKVRKGELVSAQKDYERAFQRFQQAGNLGLVRPESLTGYARSCAKKAGPLCRAWVQRFVAITPRSTEEGKALLQVFPDAYDKARPPGVSRQTQKYSAPDQDQVAFDAALATLLEGRTGATIRELTKFLEEYPRSSHRHRAKYWLAHTLLEDKEKEKADPLFEEAMRDSPFTYYGLLAAFALQKPIESQMAAALPQAMATDPFLLPQEVYRLRRAERFFAEGAPELAGQELRDLRPRDALSSPFLLYLAALHSQSGNHSGAFPILSDLIQRNAPGIYSSFVVRMIFPIVHYDLIKAQSEVNKLDPILILSLMKQESAFDEDAASHVGASGLMQLMPATAAETEPGVKRADLIVAEHNVRIGTKYLRKMLDKYNGNIAFALAAYNAGPGNVDRWIREGRAKKGLLEFIEQIPFRETRDYVATIIRNHYWYSKSLSTEAPKSLGYFWNLYGPPEVAPSTLPSALPSP